MKVLKATLSLMVGLCAYAWSDILLWQRIFENKMPWYDGLYQAGHKAVLWGFILIGAIALWDIAWSVWYVLSFYLLANGGTADILYYWLDGKELPQRLTWLDMYHPFMVAPVTNVSIIVQSFCYIFLCGTAAYVLWRMKL